MGEEWARDVAEDDEYRVVLTPWEDLEGRRHVAAAVTRRDTGASAYLGTAPAGSAREVLEDCARLLGTGRGGR